MPTKLQMIIGKRIVKEAFFSVDTSEGIPLFDAPDDPSKRYPPNVGTFLEVVKQEREQTAFCSKCHRGTDSFFTITKAEVSADAPYQTGREFPYLAGNNICCRASSAERVLAQGVTGLKINKSFEVRGHQKELIEGLGLCQLVFTGKYARFDTVLVPPTHNCCWKCGYAPIFCDECWRLTDAIGGDWNCPTCQAVILKDPENRGPREAIENYLLRDEIGQGALNIKYWNGEDCFSGIYNLVTSRAAKIMREIGFEHLFAKPVRACLDHCTPEQAKAVEELAKISIRRPVVKAVPRPKKTE